jgi:hypothetical protein
MVCYPNWYQHIQFMKKVERVDVATKKRVDDAYEEAYLL